jgi:DNA uptake protein ComE-like DNA-binding protein
MTKTKDGLPPSDPSTAPSSSVSSSEVLSLTNGGASSSPLEKYIYGQGIVDNPENCDDRVVVTVERKLTSGWIVVEADVPSGQLPRRFTCVPHLDLKPCGADSHTQAKPEERIDLNHCSAADLLKAVPGLGVFAHYLIDRRPRTLYSSIAQLKQLNTDLSIDWAGLQSRIVLN